MAADKQLKVIALTQDNSFEDFYSLTLIDAGATDGFQVAGDDGVYGQIPTGIVVNFGPADLKPIKKVFVKATPTKSLNVTALLLK